MRYDPLLIVCHVWSTYVRLLFILFLELECITLEISGSTHYQRYCTLFNLSGFYTNQEIGGFINFSVIPLKIFSGISIFVKSIIMMAKAIFSLKSWKFCETIRLVSFGKIPRYQNFCFCSFKTSWCRFSCIIKWKPVSSILAWHWWFWSSWNLGKPVILCYFWRTLFVWIDFNIERLGINLFSFCFHK